jgi:hypothetical protein
MLGSMKRSEAYAWLLALASSSTFARDANQCAPIFEAAEKRITCKVWNAYNASYSKK